MPKSNCGRTEYKKVSQCPFRKPVVFPWPQTFSFLNHLRNDWNNLDCDVKHLYTRPHSTHTDMTMFVVWCSLVNTILYMLIINTLACVYSILFSFLYCVLLASPTVKSCLVAFCFRKFYELLLWILCVEFFRQYMLWMAHFFAICCSIGSKPKSSCVTFRALAGQSGIVSKTNPLQTL